MEEAMRGVSDDAAHLNLNQTARDYLNKLQQEANNLNLFAILDRSSDEYKNSVIYSGEIAPNQDLYNLVRKPSNYYAQSTSDLLMLSALRENAAYFEQAKKAEALKLYQGGLSQIDAYEKFAAIYAESYAEKGDKELLKSAQAYRARANALKNTMQSQYPNASGLFSFSELWNAANPMGQVVANSLIESGSDTAWGQLFKVNRLPTVGKTTGYENATVRISSGSLRAEKYSHNWESADLNNVIQKFAGDNYNTYITDTGKKYMRIQ